MSKHNLYEMLSLHRTDSPAEIASKINWMASQPGLSPERADQLHTAYAILGDPVRRQIYDRHLDEPTAPKMTVTELHQLAQSHPAGSDNVEFHSRGPDNLEGQETGTTTAGAHHTGETARSAFTTIPSGHTIAAALKRKPLITATAGAVTTFLLSMTLLAACSDDGESGGGGGNSTSGGGASSGDWPTGSHMDQIDIMADGESVEVDGNGDGSVDYTVSLDDVRFSTVAESGVWGERNKPGDLPVLCAQQSISFSDEVMDDLRIIADTEHIDFNDLYTELLANGHNFEAQSVDEAWAPIRDAWVPIIEDGFRDRYVGSHSRLGDMSGRFIEDIAENRSVEELVSILAFHERGPFDQVQWKAHAVDDETGGIVGSTEFNDATFAMEAENTLSSGSGSTDLEGIPAADSDGRSVSFTQCSVLSYAETGMEVEEVPLWVYMPAKVGDNTTFVNVEYPGWVLEQ